MKKFKFRLQRLLDIREAREKEIKNELAKLISVQNRERSRQDDLRKRIEEQKNKYSGKMRSGRYSISEAVMYERFVDVSLRAIDAAEDRILAMEPEIRMVRERLVQASRERKVVDKLKERRKREYNDLAGREIAKENDDMNQKIYARRAAEAGGER
ncbi:MAG: flagellar export protein FliJ [Spirochaetes bacterium]|jgi:flagellar FliJ protein|nr:flagellar export protein FliJ [Spirochaetota bacterium]